MSESSSDSQGGEVNRPLNSNVKDYSKAMELSKVMMFMLFYGFSEAIHIRYRNNLIYFQLCKEHFQSNYEFCYNKTHEDYNDTDKDPRVVEVISTSSTHVCAMIGLKIIIECFSASLLCSWSDKYGRKIPLLIAILGENFDISSFFVSNIPFAYFIWIFYVLTVLSGLFGGNICIFAMTYCYSVDCSSLKYRALAFTMVDFTYVIGIISGVVTYKRLILTNVIFVCFLCLLTARCIIILWTSTTFSDKKFDCMEEKLMTKIKLFFTLTHWKQVYEVVSKWRSNCRNEQLVLLICSAVPVLISYSLIEGVILDSSIHALLFGSFRDYEEITLYFAVYSCIAEPVALVIYQSLSKFKDSTLGIIGFLNLYLNAFIEAFAKDYLTFLVGLGLSPLKGFAAVGLRSSYSRIGQETEQGKLFFFYSLSEVLATFFGYFLYEKLRYILTPKDDILPHMVLSMALIVALCTFTFQAMSIHTDHLFEDCYRNVPIDSITNSCRPGRSSRT